MNDREQNRAERMPDDVPFEVKKRRNNELLDVQNEIIEQDNQKFLGETVSVLVEGPSKRSEAKVNERADVDADGNGLVQLTGRTHCDRIVVFDGTKRLVGQTIPVGIFEIAAHTLIGTVITDNASTGQSVTLMG